LVGQRGCAKRRGRQVEKEKKKARKDPTGGGPGEACGKIADPYSVHKKGKCAARNILVTEEQGEVPASGVPTGGRRGGERTGGEKIKSEDQRATTISHRWGVRGKEVTEGIGVKLCNKSQKGTILLAIMGPAEGRVTESGGKVGGAMPIKGE